MKALDGVLEDGKKLADDAVDAARRGRGGKPAATAPVSGAQAPKKPKKPLPPEVLENFNRGNQFNKDREPYYTARGGGNELTLDNGKRVDSYIPDEEIVSRKHTQLDKVKEETAVGYLRELDSKYSTDATVKDTEHARSQIGDAAGKKLSGDPILEVPPQDDPVPPAVISAADDLGITIRDSNGHSYN
ncbi:hypothetical protein [Catenuloplanes indicus]|nr:hypothetical protein [Catenuloplanes indicus]